MGHKHTEEEKIKMSVRHSGKGNPFYGKTHTPSNRKKMSDASKRKNQRLGNIPGTGVIHDKIWNLHHPDNPIVPGDGNVVHHKDFNHDNNDPDNLQKMTKAEHNKLHHEGKKRSAKACENISKGLTGKFPKGKHYLNGVKRSEETKQRMSEAASRRWANERKRRS